MSILYYQSTYEETRLDESDVGDKKKWLKEGMDCNLLLWNGKVTFSSHNLLPYFTLKPLFSRPVLMMTKSGLNFLKT
jgi:hypothetical protein